MDDESGILPQCAVTCTALRTRSFSTRAVQVSGDSGVAFVTVRLLERIPGRRTLLGSRTTLERVVHVHRTCPERARNQSALWIMPACIAARSRFCSSTLQLQSRRQVPLTRPACRSLAGGTFRKSWICSVSNRECESHGTTSAPNVPTVYVRSEKAHLFARQVRPLIFGRAIVVPTTRPNGTYEALQPRTDDLVCVRLATSGLEGQGGRTDTPGPVLGYGFYNPDSMYRVRLIWQNRLDGDSVPLLKYPDGSYRVDLLRVLTRLFTAAWRLRERLGLVGSAHAACRLINGEGDRVSGLCIDLYARYLVVQSSARWVEHHRPVIEQALRNVTKNAYELVWRSNSDRLRQDGFVMSDDPSRATAPGAASTMTPRASSTAATWITEHGLMYEVDIMHGQKTGHYCDQRDNRLFIRHLVQEASIQRVLDLCTYTGGFALNAVLGGALHVTAVDSSGQALMQAHRNAERNQVSSRLILDKEPGIPGESPPTLWLVRDDVQRFCERLESHIEHHPESTQRYDLVVLDPPKLAPTVESLPRARHRYRKMNAAALRLVRSSGFLFTCTCSASMTQSGQFSAVLMEAALDAGRRITILAERGAALDHVVSPAAPEGRYLTAMLLAVE